MLAQVARDALRDLGWLGIFLADDLPFPPDIIALKHVSKVLRHCNNPDFLFLIFKPVFEHWAGGDATPTNRTEKQCSAGLLKCPRILLPYFRARMPAFLRQHLDKNGRMWSLIFSSSSSSSARFPLIMKLIEALASIIPSPPLTWRTSQLLKCSFSTPTMCRSWTSWGAIQSWSHILVVNFAKAWNNRKLMGCYKNESILRDVPQSSVKYSLRSDWFWDFPGMKIEQCHHSLLPRSTVVSHSGSSDSFFTRAQIHFSQVPQSSVSFSGNWLWRVEILIFDSNLS